MFTVWIKLVRAVETMFSDCSSMQHYVITNEFHYVINGKDTRREYTRDNTAISSKNYLPEIHSRYLILEENRPK